MTEVDIHSDSSEVGRGLRGIPMGNRCRTHAHTLEQRRVHRGDRDQGRLLQNVDIPNGDRKEDCAALLYSIPELTSGTHGTANTLGTSLNCTEHES